MSIIDDAKRAYSLRGFAGPCEVYEHASEHERAQANLYRQKFPTSSGLDNARRFASAVMQDEPL